MTDVQKTIAMITCKHDHAMLAVVERLTGVGGLPKSDVWAVAERIIGGGANPAMKAVIDRITGPHLGMSPAIERMLAQATRLKARGDVTVQAKLKDEA